MSNPLANENAVIKIKKKMKKQDIIYESGAIKVELIGMNNAIPICAEVCSCCWDKQIPDDYAGKAEYIANRSRIGYASILEHSNYVLYLSIGSSYSDDLIAFLDWVNYLHTKLIKSSDGSRWHLILGGSFRGFADIYRESDDLNNPILKAITGNLYMYANSAAFTDICSLGLLDQTMFKNIEPDENCCILTNEAAVEFEVDLFKIIGVDDISKLYTNLYNADEDAASNITTYDLIKFVTVSVLFKNMSRTCARQLVGHRNTITEESQIYADYNKSCFYNPVDFENGKYDKDHKYRIRFATSAQMNLTLDEIGKAMCDIYGMLHNPAIAGQEHALLRHDAIAFLPNNAQYKKIYMTFTYKNLFKFLNLKENPSAQAEIRTYAKALGDVFRENTKFETKEIMDLYTQPRLLVADPFTFDVDMGEHEEVIDLTPEDYIKAAGLGGTDNEEEVSNLSNLKNGDEV